ncbi:M20 family metallopeptidase [Sporosarcina siberiensis]|uniref:M20 family metallopeptidase n=1 Tax=Sporosarcina siberiensis TaxID=1365606 RepID=A0ABW4SGH0_9BACL
MKNHLYEKLDILYDEMIHIRRYLHQHPELSYKEVKTPAYIADYHRSLGHEVRTEVGGRGVVATLRGEKPGKTIALRADFDALPIHEETDAPYKSTVDGVMHACGHDGHTATLLVLAKVLNSMKGELQGDVVFIHQHAEEVYPGGAIEMIADGCLKGVDVIFGTHLWSSFPYGTIEYRSGTIMAASASFEIEILGKGGHGAQPHLTRDALVIGAQLVTTLQQIVSRRVNPIDSVVVTVGNFVAKNAPNVIADKAILNGTVRTLDVKIHDSIEQEMKRIVQGTCIAAGVDYRFEYNRGYPPVVNHHEETMFLAQVAETVPGVDAVNEMEISMGGEDFGYYLQHVKGTFFFTGAENPEWSVTYPHHHPKFDIDERAMLIAAKTLGGALLEYHKKIEGDL